MKIENGTFYWCFGKPNRGCEGCLQHNGCVDKWEKNQKLVKKTVKE